MGGMGFWQELKRRHVYRVAAAYAVVGWLLIQVATQVFPIFHFPDWIDQAVVLAILIGFPIALVLAWAFDVSPAGGIRRVTADGQLVLNDRRHGILAVGVIGVLLAALAGAGWWWSQRAPAPPVGSVAVESARSPDATQRLRLQGVQTRTAEPARRVSDRDVANQSGADILPDSAAGAASSGLRATAVSAIAQAVPIPAKSIAVLPFENLSADKNNAYFADGMQDLILTKLADIGDLKVIARTATEKYQSHPEDLKAIGRQLGVATFLEGSVQRAGKQVLINVQLIDANTDAHIWAQSYTRTLDNIFGVEGEVAGKVAKALDAKLTASETSAVAHVPTTNPQAYDDYLRALHFDNEASKGDWTTFLPQAIAAAKKAVAEDPGFALAWAKLAGVRIGTYYWGGDRNDANLRAAETAAKRALALSPNLPEAHLAMAGIERFLYHDLVATRDQVQQAVDLRPNDADALSELAIADGNLGNGDAGLKLIRRAIALDPTNSFYEFQFGWMLASKGNYAAARQAERRALAIDPQFALAYLALSEIDIAQDGDVEAATQVLDHMAPGTPLNAQVASMRIDLLLYRRQFTAARALAEQYSGKFKTGGAAMAITLARANIEWLTGKMDRAQALYRAAIRTMTQSGAGISIGDHMKLGLAYARLGETDAAMKQFDVVLKHERSQKGSARPITKYVLAEAQLAFGRKSAAIDTLGQFAALETHNLTVWSATPALLRIDPVWDPIRDDPHFQVLLKKYSGNLPAAGVVTGTDDG